MPPTREQTCQQAARTLESAAPNLANVLATVGLDGFVDEIIAVVDQRHDLERFDAVPTIDAFGRKILDAAGQSSNYELMVKQMKLGGNGPIMANALAAAGLGVTYVGAVGMPPNLHPAFAELASRAAVIPIGEPGHTDALEFADGKLMLGKYTREMGEVNWANLMTRLGRERFASLMEVSTLIAMTNWTMLPFMSDIWRQMIAAGVPSREGRKRTLFVDLADPEKRPRQDIREALDLLQQFQKQVDVVLGLNFKEAAQVLPVLGLEGMKGGENDLPGIAGAARAVRERLGLSCVVIHPRAGAGAASEAGAASFSGPFVKEPKISTGAGDHFNAGFCLGWVLGMELDACLCTGTATSGYYVRSAQSPSAADLAGFIANLPPPQ